MSEQILTANSMQMPKPIGGRTTPWRIGPLRRALFLFGHACAKIRVGRFGHVEHAIPRDFVAVARDLRHAKEEPLAMDLNIHGFAAVINLKG